MQYWLRKLDLAPKYKSHSVALYGSVLDRGESEKDLDLFFVEQESDIRDVQHCLDEISKLPEIHHFSAHSSPSGPLCVIWLQDRKHYIDAQFRLLPTK